MEQIKNLMKLAHLKGLLRCEGFGKLEDFENDSKLTKCIFSLGEMISKSSDGKKDEGENKAREIEVDFSSDSDREKLRYELKKMLPVAEIIDLVHLAIESGVIDEKPEKDLDSSEIGKDGEKDKKVGDAAEFKSFNKDYCKITQLDYHFNFTILHETRKDDSYNVAFNENLSNSEVEYASRASRFVDTLVKRITTKYNVLSVQEASFDVKNDEKHRPAIAEGFKIKAMKRDHGDEESSEIKSQMKLLIHYRDHVASETYSESVIDDIHVSFTDGKPKYDFMKIEPNKDAKPIREPMDITKEEGVKEIFDKLTDKEEKYNIFNELRKHDQSNLHRLIEKRLDEYVKYRDENGEEPRVEFTMSLLAIYINRIIKDVVDFEISYDLKKLGKDTHEYLKGVSATYPKIFDPSKPDTLDKFPYKGSEDGPYLFSEKEAVEAKRRKGTVSEDKVLVCALLNNPIKWNIESAKIEFLPPEKIKTEALPLSETYASDDKIFNNFYNTPELKGIRFAKSEVVEVEDLYGNKVSCLKSDAETCKISGKKYHKKDMRLIKGEEINNVIVEGEDLSSETEVWIANKTEYQHRCELCHTMYYADESNWEKYKKEYALYYNASLNAAKHCCGACKGTVRNDIYFVFNGNGADGKKYYFVDDKNVLEHTELCHCCVDGFILKDHDKTKEVSGRCEICGQLYCAKHIVKHTHKGAKEGSLDNNYYICHHCYKDGDGKLKQYRDFDNSGESKSIWKKIRHLIKTGKRNECMYYLSSDKNELRVCEKNKKFDRIYYFVTEEGSGVYFLKKMHKEG